jgi:hypothetical protein
MALRHETINALFGSFVLLPIWIIASICGARS